MNAKFHQHSCYYKTKPGGQTQPVDCLLRHLAAYGSTNVTLRSPGEWQDSLLTCLLDFDQAGFAPAG